MLIRFVTYNWYAKDTFLSRLVTLYMVRLDLPSVSVIYVFDGVLLCMSTYSF